MGARIHDKTWRSSGGAVGPTVQAIPPGAFPSPVSTGLLTVMEGKLLWVYRIESELGSGGMGKVYLAERGEDRFAVKIVHPHLVSEPGFFKRFLREAEIGKAVTHRNVVRCYDCDQLVVDGITHAFLVMEYVEGQTLRSLIEESETVPEGLCRHIGRELSKGLAAIKGAGFVHGRSWWRGGSIRRRVEAVDRRGWIAGGENCS